MKISASLTRLGAALSLVAVSTPAFAHHPVQAKFDEGSPLALTGQVTHVDWANPHAHIFLNVEGEDGALVNWAIELESPVDLEWGGWGPESVKVGDRISVNGPRARDGSEQLWGEVISEAGGGERLFALAPDVRALRLADRPQGDTPRWPDGQPMLGPPPGETGYWTNPAGGSLVEVGVEVEMDEHGLLRDIGDAARIAPFQDWARDLYVLRQGNSLADDPKFLFCIPPGGPRQFQIPYGVQFVEQRVRDRIFVLMGGGNSNWRLIYTDGREQLSQVSGNDDNPLFYGRSVAAWEDDTLVIRTNGFNETFWFSNGGLPHTSLLQLEERLTRTDLNTLRYEVTVDDPGAYTRPWRSAWNLEWVPGEELPEYYCQDNRP